jgi:plasmid stabilization system protein ParE
MRRIVRSRTYTRQLQDLIEFGADRFGVLVANDKLAELDRTVRQHLAFFPGTGKRDRRLGLRSHAVSRTPFVVLYDFDDEELRLHFVVHKRADRRRLDPGDVEW